MTERGWDRLGVGVLLAAGLLGVASRFHDQLGLTGDNAVYLLLARNLATGQPYDNGGFPWGYPALLVPGVAWFGPDRLITAVPWLKGLTIVAFLGAIPLFYALFRRRHAPLLAFAASALWVVNDITLTYANDLMTELPYMAASAAALLWWQARVDRDAGAGSREQGAGVGDQESTVSVPTSYLVPRTSYLVAGLLLLVPYYLRTIGLTLVAAAPFMLAWRGRWRAAVGLGVGLAAGVAPWLIFTRTAGLPSYFDSWFLRDPYTPAAGRIANAGEFVQTFLGRIGTYTNIVVPALLIPLAPGATWVSALSWLALAGMALGWGRRLVRRVELPEVYVLGFVLTLGSWPWIGDRFLLPILPLLCHYLLDAVAWSAAGLGALWRRRDPARVRRAAPLAGVALLLGLALLVAPQLARDAQAADRAMTYWRTGDSALLPDMDPAWQEYFAACAWLRDHTPPGAVILSRKSSLTTIYAGRPSVLIPLIDPASYPAFLRDHQIAYILDDAFPWSTHTLNYLRPALAQFPARFRLLYTTPPPATRVWQVEP